MGKTKQLVEDLNYLEGVGMTVAQLRLMHHWGGDREREGRITFATARSYFEKERDLLENNDAFANRLRLVANMNRRGLSALVEHSLSQFPRH